MAGLSEKIAVKEAIQQILSQLTKDEQFEILDDLLTDYPEQMITSVIGGLMEMNGL